MAKMAPTKPVFTTLNEHLVCTLCTGYLVDATTIVECLHSFCRSCIVQYLQASSFCPRCEVQLHKGSPLRSLKPDKTLQDIVFKLVPNLFHNEMQRRRVYYDAHPQYADQTTPEQRGDCLERFYSPDDSISLSLEYHDRRKSSENSSPDQKKLPPKRYLKCPAMFTVGLLKKFLRLKFDLPPEIMIDIFQRRESLADEYTLLDIAYIYPWKRSAPMQFFYRIRDPRVPESDDEVEREMPSLSAAVTGRATRASRRASSASSLASPMNSPRASPIPGVKRPKTEPTVEDDSPPPAKLTAQPPSGTVLPKPKAATPAPLPAPAASPAQPAPKVTSPTSSGPKITLTISPSRGTVTSTTTELPKHDPPAKKCLAPSAPVPAPAKNGAAPATPKAFTATVTTKTANGGFVTVKNPIARTPNGVMAGNKSTPSTTPAAKTPVTAPKMPNHTPIAPKPAQPAPKRLPTLAPKVDQTPPNSTLNKSQITTQAPPRTTAPPSRAPVADKKTPVGKASSAPTPVSKVPSAPAPVSKAPSAPAPGTKPPTQVAEEEKNKVETAKAILQLSMGLQHNSRSNTPTDSTLHNRIDKIVKDLQDDESNDGTLVIKSEPASPAGSHERDSPAPRDGSAATATSAMPATTPSTPTAPKPRTEPPAPLPPSLPRVNGLTITPIEPTKRKATSSPAVDEKKAKMDNKRPSDSPVASGVPAKVAKVDKIAESIKQKQEMMIRQQDKRPPTPQRSSPGPIANLPPGLTIHPQTSTPKTPVPARQPGPSQQGQHQVARHQPPLLPKPAPTPTTYKPQNQQAKLGQLHQQSRPQSLQPKPVAQARAGQQGQQARPVQQQQQQQQQGKPAQPGQQSRPFTAGQPGHPQGQQVKQQTYPPKQAAQGPPKPPPQGQSPMLSRPQQTPPPKPSPQGLQAKPQQVPPPRPSPQGQQAKPQQVPPSRPSPQGQQAKPQQVQPPRQSPQGQQAHPANRPPTPQQVQTPKASPGQQPKPTPQQTVPPKQSPTGQPIKKAPSPESPVKNKKPIPDLQRLQRPPASLSGTTVNGSLSLAEIKEHLAKKGQYSPPAPNRTPPRLIEISQPPPPPQQPQQRKSAPGSSFGALDLTSASPRADHGGGWTPPPGFMTQNLAQTLAKRHQLMQQLRPPPSSLSSSSPSPPADGPASPDMYLDPNVLAQQQALIQQLHLQSLLQAQAAGLQANLHQAGLSAGLKKAIEDWSASERFGVKATAKRK